MNNNLFFFTVGKCNMGSPVVFTLYTCFFVMLIKLRLPGTYANNKIADTNYLV